MHSFTVNNPKYWSAINRKANVWSWLPEMQIEYPCEVGDNYLAPIKENTSIDLKPEQLLVFEDIKDKVSSLVFAKTSFGKSLIVCATSEAWGDKTLILADRIENASHIVRQFKKFRNIETGQVFGGKNDIKDITVTTYASFKLKVRLFTEYGFKNLMIDECDTAFSDKMLKVIKNFPFERLLGLTGTVSTIYDTIKKGYKPEVSALEKYYQYTYTADSNNEDSPLKEFYVRKYKKEYKGENGEIIKPHMWHDFREILNADMDRKKAMLEYIQETSTEKEYRLALFDRIADVEVFYKSAKNRDMNCYMHTGSFKDHIEEFKEKGGLLFATYTTVGRGFDLPPLSKVYILFPLRLAKTLEQIIGRIKRKFFNKESFAYLWSDSSLEYQFEVKDKRLNSTRIKAVIKSEFNKELIEI